MSLSRRSVFYVTEDRYQTENVLMLTVNGNPSDDEIRAAREFVMTVPADVLADLLGMNDSAIARAMTSLLDAADINARVSSLPVLGALDHI